MVYALKTLMGNKDEVGLPKPWDNELFPDIKPVGLEVALRALFEEKKKRSE
jgi:hypothetical protein